MRILLTGATGFIGRAVLKSLVGRGYQVRALARAGGKGKIPAHSSVEVVTGDLLDRASLHNAVRGVDALIHTAALYSYWSPDRSLIYRTNVDGAGALLLAAREAGVRRVVVTSTVATLKAPDKGRLADETSVAEVDELPGHYKKSKLLAEQAALSLSSPQFEVIVVNPTAPFGPGDTRPTPTGRIVLEFLNRRFPGYVATGMNVCDVDDVAEGHVLALEKGRPGERYVLGGENMTLREIYGLLARATGLTRRPVRAPYALAFAAGYVDTFIEGRLLGRTPYVPVEGLRVARRPMYVDTRKAVDELGLPQRPAIESLLRAAQWFASNGYSRARISLIENTGVVAR